MNTKKVLACSIVSDSESICNFSSLNAEYEKSFKISSGFSFVRSVFVVSIPNALLCTCSKQILVLC
ncbi:MAG: hypothetical protein ACKPKO_01755, partial [Candidatus Fonsibacter sp.]